MSREIEIIIRRDGTVKIEAFGYEGPACAADLDWLQETIGKVKEEEHKPEFYNTQSTSDRNQIRG